MLFFREMLRDDSLEAKFEYFELFIKQSFAGDPLFKSKSDSASFKEESKGII